MANNQIKTGSYAVTTVYSMPWAKKTVTVDKTKRKRAEKKVVHDLFDKCSEITDDTYWVSIFKDCSRDKFPRGFFYKNGLMTHRKGNKIKRMVIPYSPHEALSTCISFFKSAAGLMSANDRKKMQKEEEEKLLETMNDKVITWKDIKIERIKELLISEYIRDLALEMNFTEDQKNDLITTVRSGFMLKYFGSKNIQMEGGKISAIEGLVYSNSQNKYFIDPRLVSKRSVKKVKGLGIEKTGPKCKVHFMTMWEKYLTNLEKRNHINTSYNFQVIEGASHSVESGTTCDVSCESFTPGGSC